MFKYIIFLVIFLILVAVLVDSIKIVPQSKAAVVERLGSYYTTWANGIHFKMPFIDRVANRVTLKEIVHDFAPQPVITKDNVTMMIDTVVYFSITDPKLYTYGIERPVNAIENLTATTLRNIIGDLELDETLTSRDVINTKMRAILDEATDPWGVKVSRVEVKNIIPPRDIQESMEKQMRAERERREAILRAEGEKRAAILTAEGEQQSMILRANAKKEATIAEAEGQARSIEVLYEAQARGIEMINKANPNQAFLTMKGFETFQKVADGKATKLIIPSNIQDISSTIASLAEVAKTTKQDESGNL